MMGEVSGRGLNGRTRVARAPALLESGHDAVAAYGSRLAQSRRRTS